ncbi:hypothetical protein C2E23DRAFT_848897 [Lenzites betulinus]|nr:hypothetical protein C2E23DRAFT_848897 [Lenzites betulinus]
MWEGPRCFSGTAGLALFSYTRRGGTHGVRPGPGHDTLWAGCISGAWALDSIIIHSLFLRISLYSAIPAPATCRSRSAKMAGARAPWTADD